MLHISGDARTIREGLNTTASRVDYQAIKFRQVFTAAMTSAHYKDGWRKDRRDLRATRDAGSAQALLRRRTSLDATSEKQHRPRHQCQPHQIQQKDVAFVKIKQS